MLVLTRKPTEGVIIQAGAMRIRLVPVEIRGDKVRFGIEAPRELPVDREEIRAAKERDAARARAAPKGVRG